MAHFLSTVKKTSSFAIAILAIVIILPLSSGQGGNAANVCSTSNGFCATIQYDKSISANNTIATSTTTLTSPFFSVIQNETIIVATHSSLNGANVSSVTDTMGNTYTFIARSGTTLTEGWEDVWTAQATQSILGSITVVWNKPDTVIFEASIYKNAKGVGAVVTANSQVSNVISLTTSLTATTSGSWVLGIAGTNNVGNSAPFPCRALKPTTPPFVQRIYSCSGDKNVNLDSMFMSDNATGLVNGSTLSFAASSTTVNVNSIDIIELELLAVDVEFNLNPCLANPVSCNSFGGAKTSANALATLTVNTEYCTGVTSNGISLTAPGIVQMLGSYSGQSRNATGAKLLVKFYLTTTVPSTTFAAGVCASGGVFAFTTIYLPTSGSTLTLNGPNVYMGSLIGYCYTTQSPCNNLTPPITVYASLTITPQNIAQAMTYAQWATGSSVAITQIK